MTETSTQHAAGWFDDDLPDETIALVRHWLDESARVPQDKAASRLASLLKDPAGLDFTVGFVDRVIRPEDARVAARNFAQLAQRTPAFLPRHLRAAIRVGGWAGLVVPRLVIPIVKRTLRSMVDHLIIDATDKQLARAIARISRNGARLNVNLLGEAVLGEREADRRVERTHELLARSDVDYVSIKVSATVAPHSPWAFEESVDVIVDSLIPLFRRAADFPVKKFINLDMEEYKDLDLTIAVFTKILDREEFLDLDAGIVLQAYLPDSMEAMIHLQDWSAARRERGGAAIKVRVVKGANLPMERVESSLHGWPLSTWDSKVETDTNYKRVINYALDSARIDNVRLGIAGHNLFDIAFAWLLAGRRDVRHGVEFEMLLGMAQGQASVVQREVGGLLLYTPVVHPEEFDVAIAYLIRRLEEGASSDNFMSAVFELHDDQELFVREQVRFLTSLARLDDSVPSAKRQQNRQLPESFVAEGSFRNCEDTDTSLAANRQWGRNILDRVRPSQLGVETIAAHTITDSESLELVISEAVSASSSWGEKSGDERADHLDRAAHQLELQRADLLEVMAAEAGKTLDQSDTEVSEAIDFARYYAELARKLDSVDGARYTPSRLIVVTPPWNFPVAIPTGSTVAALASGASVIIKPAPQAERCAAVMVEALWEAGIPREVLHLVSVDESVLGRQLISDPRVDRLILTGAYETAELFTSFRPDLSLLAETSGKNAIVVTPSADFDLAARDVALSAFGHAGQKCSAASLVILVGSVAKSARFRRQLVDAVSALHVGRPCQALSQMGPLIEPVGGKLLEALTELGPGESWLIAPERLDSSGKMWSPGVREGVRRGSEYHLTEYFGPVLGILTARNLNEAIDIQNQVDYGLTAGLHSLDSDELGLWLEKVEAGNLYVNRGITGAIVRRQPFGGWKKSSVGAGTKAGGPNYLVGLGDWTTKPAQAFEDVHPRSRMFLSATMENEVPAEEQLFLRRSFGSDAMAWECEFSASKDVSGLSAERNVFRYLPVPVTVRLAADGSIAQLIRVIGAAQTASAHVEVSTPEPLPRSITTLLRSWDVPVILEHSAKWHARAGRLPSGRIRLIGAPDPELFEALARRPDIAVYDHEVTESGYIEMLPFFREQAISITAHRFGTPNTFSERLL